MPVGSRKPATSRNLAGEGARKASTPESNVRVCSKRQSYKDIRRMQIRKLEGVLTRPWCSLENGSEYNERWDFGIDESNGAHISMCRGRQRLSYLTIIEVEIAHSKIQ